MPMMPTSLLSAISDALRLSDHDRPMIGEFRRLFGANTTNVGANMISAPEGSLHD
jgi:hypothetical protein